jgi:hypothetical protein
MSSVQRLMNVPVGDRGLGWLKESLQCAVVLEHATLPPYLCAMWSIQDVTHEAFDIIRGIVLQEMLHMGLACNLLAAIGGSPEISGPDFVPKYPGPLPCEVRPLLKPDLRIGLSRLTLAIVADVFMMIEYPEHGPVALAERRTFHTIGEFYGAIGDCFRALNPPLTEGRQLEYDITLNAQLFKILTTDDALCAIEQIVELAHYYKFKQLYVGRLYQQNSEGKWELNGPMINFPAVFPMADVPAGGYSGPDVPAEVGQFNTQYSALLSGLQSAWDQGGAGGQESLDDAIATMNRLRGLAQILMRDKAIPGGGGATYGPTFRV